MKDDPTSSEMKVFQSFVLRAMEIKGNLSQSYQGERYLRNRLQEAIDFTSFQEFLKDRPSKSSQDLINHVANRLSNRPKAAGSILASWVLNEGYQKEYAAMYGLGQKYGGGAVRTEK